MTFSISTIAQAKWAFSTRRIDPALVAGINADVTAATAGQLILGRVVSIGQHQRIQLVVGRHATLYPGDLVVLPCGARYAPDQFEGVGDLAAGNGYGNIGAGAFRRRAGGEGPGSASGGRYYRGFSGHAAPGSVGTDCLAGGTARQSAPGADARAKHSAPR
ncbi:hypothetical protein [Brenneria rubrifaciens]|uniref:Uncharacterized protein n=1 Tax=Brenneria rubrifaciens TaxID=55213 RepID=A0A4P8QRF9_9GAMM|nr:hypothetical protein [Brenneria rubrifaciens]QCR09712.1 hypothetical protein EH207_14985 [Brenneria rubrifaciens]